MRHIITILCMHCRWPRQEKCLTKCPKLFWIFVVFVVCQGRSLHILFMPPIKQPYTLKTLVENGGNKNKRWPSKEGDKYLTSHTPMLSKPIVVRLDLNLLLDFINFKASTILKHEEDKRWKVDRAKEFYDEEISCTMDCEGFYKYM